MSAGKIEADISSSRMMPCEMVRDTSVDRNAPTRLSTAASSTATLGFRAPVAMGVAIALAVSWNPFVKSKNSARAMTRTMISAAVSTVGLPGGGSRRGAEHIGTVNEEFTWTSRRVHRPSNPRTSRCDSPRRPPSPVRRRTTAADPARDTQRATQSDPPPGANMQDTHPQQVCPQYSRRADSCPAADRHGSSPGRPSPEWSQREGSSPSPRRWRSSSTARRARSWPSARSSSTSSRGPSRSSRSRRSATSTSPRCSSAWASRSSSPPPWPASCSTCGRRWA